MLKLRFFSPVFKDGLNVTKFLSAILIILVRKLLLQTQDLLRVCQGKQRVGAESWWFSRQLLSPTERAPCECKLDGMVAC